MRMEDSTVMDPSEKGRLREGREGLDESPLEGLELSVNDTLSVALLRRVKQAGARLTGSLPS